MGIVAVLISTLFFYLSTFFVQWGRLFFPTPSIYFVLSRFIFGYLFLVLYVTATRGSAILQEMHSLSASFWLWGRALGNSTAVFLFFAGVAYGNVTNANFLNMLYPAFVALFSPWLLKEKNNFWSLLGVFLAMVGAYLISQKGGKPVFSHGDLFAFFSAVLASFAIIALRALRKDKVETLRVLFFTFYIGTIISFVVLLFYLLVTGQGKEGGVQQFLRLQTLAIRQNSLNLVAAAVVGFWGQFFLTFGFRYVSAVQGSLLSDFRIFIALLFAWFFWHQPFLWASFLGALCIFVANMLLALKKKEKRKLS